MIPIDWAFCRGIEIVAYVVPRSAANPESSDCAGLNALPVMKKEMKKNESFADHNE